MRVYLSRAALAATSVLAGLAAATARAAEPVAPEVHKMVIVNGQTETVHYFGVGLSTSEQAALREVQRAENEAAYADDLQSLRRRYVANEIALEPHRRAVQQALYGTSITQTVDSPVVGADFVPGYCGPGARRYPYAYSYRAGYGPSYAGATTTVNQSLVFGVGDEGAIKTSMAAVIAGQATPEYAAAADKAYADAVNAGARSEAIRAALTVPRPVFLPVVHQPPQPVTLTLRAGLGDKGKIDGNVIEEDADSITVETDTDQVTVRKADVALIARHKSGH